MASLMMHEAVASCIARKIGLSNLHRFRLGNIIADAKNQDNTQQEKFAKKQRSHYLESLGGNFVKVNYSKFFEKHKEEMGDDAVLGYYIHLFTDEVCLRKINDKYLDFLPDGMERTTKVQQYYRDLHRLNPHLIQEFGIRNNINMDESSEINLYETDDGDERIITEEINGHFNENHLSSEHLELLDRAELIKILKEVGDLCIKEIMGLGLREQREVNASQERG